MSNVFTLAKAYAKKHPRTSWQDCIKAVAGKKKKSAPAKRTAAAKKSAPKKRAVGSAPAKRKAVQVKVKKKGNTVRMTIGSIGSYSLDKIGKEQRALAALQATLEKIRLSEKVKGITAAIKRQYKADKAKIMNAIKASKALITQYKKSL